MYNKEMWMKENEIQKENEYLTILNDKSLKSSDKAKQLGFKKSRVYVDNLPKTGWVNGEELHLKLKDLISCRSKYPLGFDFYYWGNELFKMKDS